MPRWSLTATNLGFSSAQIINGLRSEPFVTFDNLLAKSVLVLLSPVSSSVCLEPYIYIYPSCVVHDFFVITITGWNGVHASLSSRRFLFFDLSSGHYYGFTHFWHVWPLSWTNLSWSCCDLFLRQSALNPHFPSGGFLIALRESCHTDPWFRQWLTSIHVPIIIDGRLLKYINACFSFVSEPRFTAVFSQKWKSSQETFSDREGISSGHQTVQGKGETFFRFSDWKKLLEKQGDHQVAEAKPEIS